MVVEQLAPFRGSGELKASMLVRAGRRLALGEIELDDEAETIDLDAPAVLVRERLRPSKVATRQRAVTQRWAAELFSRHAAAALMWWSTFEAGWVNATVFDRAGGALSVRAVEELEAGSPLVREAASFLALRIR